ncbi:MAG: HRDC domain-containing protein [Methylococcaceae bacterium]
MKMHFFTVPAKWPEQAQQTLNAFCAQHRVMTLEKQFVDVGIESYWSICVTFMEGINLPVAGNVTNRRDKIDYRDVLSEQDFALYAQLRNLRKALSEQEGIPAYALFTNEQLAGMVTGRVRSESELAKIEGVGKARLEKYGSAFLQVLKTSLPEPQEHDNAPPAH